MDALTIVVCTIVLILAGFVKGTLGLGLPLVALGLLAFVMPPQHAAILLLGPILFTNLWQVFAALGGFSLFRRLFLLLLAMLVTTFITAGILTAEDAAAAKIILGTAIVAYALFLLSGRKPSVAPRDEGWLAPIIGTISGVIAGATGVVVVPVIAYLQAIGFEKDELVQAQSVVFLIAGLALTLSFLFHRQISTIQAVESVLAIAPATLGTVLGQMVRKQLDVAAFRRILCVFLLGMGAYLIATTLL